jgi:hypothetical protein
MNKRLIKEEDYDKRHQRGTTALRLDRVIAFLLERGIDLALVADEVAKTLVTSNVASDA